MNKVLAFHNNAELKAQAEAFAKFHVDSNRLVKGNSILCTIGCLTHNFNLASYGHAELAEHLGLPVQLMHWLDTLFERSASPDNNLSTSKVFAAIPAGADLSTLFDRLAIKRNTRLLELDAVKNNQQVSDAIKRCIEARNAVIVGERSLLDEAARAARATADAADAADAAIAAADAARAARAAANAVYAAAYANELADMLESIKECL